MTDTIVLIDGHALVFRAFHAVPQLTSPKGELVNAVYGFTSMLFKAWRDLKPRYVAATFDTSSQTFRRERFADYKATRGPQPEGLGPQFEHIYHLLDCMNIPVFKLQGFEADDLLGTLSKQAEEQGLDVVILTGDMDALQLVSPQTRVLTSRRGFSDTVLYDEAAVRERYGFDPVRIPDFKALRGDTSDNIPGVPGIGDKTASKLVAQFGTIENLYEHLGDVPARHRGLLDPLHDQVVMAKDLATIVRDLPVSLNLEAAQLGNFDRPRVVGIFHDLGFRRLLDDIGKAMGDGGASDPAGGDGQLSMFEGGGAAQAEKTATLVEDGAGIVTTLDELDALVVRLREAGALAFNVQTTGTASMRADIVGLGLAIPADSAPAGSASGDGTGPAGSMTCWYVPTGHLAGEQLDWPTVRDRLGPIVADPGIKKWSHNAKFHEIVLARHGVETDGLDFDTMIAAYLLESNQRALALRDLAWSKLQIELPAGSTLLGSGRSATTMDRLDISKVGDYARDEATAVCRLVPMLAAELHEASLDELFRDIELPLVPVLVQMERSGVAIDVPYLQQLSKELAGRLAEIEAEMYAVVGHEFNVNSTHQLAQVLYDELKLPRSSRRTRTGQASTGADVLEELRGVHPIIELVLEHRQLQKLKSTYVDALPLLVNPETGRVHTSFNQTIAATGRLSSSDPGLQNIPIRTDLGKRVRRAFITGSKDACLLSADYSQIELRILAHMTHDPTLVDAFNHGRDIHAATAAEVLGIPIDQVTSDQRRLAKTVNFGVLYGMTEYGLSQQSGLPVEQAARFIKQYFERFGTVKAFQDSILRDAEERGYVTTLLGRRRYIPELKNKIWAVRASGQRQAVNHPAQGTASDIIKIAMIGVERFIDEHDLKTTMVLQVHDELVFETPRGELIPFARELRRIMQGAMTLIVPLLVELRAGDNWEDLSHLDVDTPDGEERAHQAATHQATTPQAATHPAAGEAARA
ncbi:MAG: DNA polymerase I [Chloroflexi bacterium]|nr:DNA polymerase I [Chloroflexota bacterium]